MFYVTRYNGRGYYDSTPELHQRVAQGESVENFRLVYSGDEETARKKFTDIASKLRQGAVKLFDENFQVLKSASAPRLRTRW